MDDNHLGILLEEIRGQNKAVLEAVGDMQGQLGLTAKQADLEEIKADIKTIKAALIATNHQVQDHEQRLTKLESASTSV